MRVHDGHVMLSPSDLSAYLACPHLTALELEVVHGLRPQPHGRDALTELIAEKGDAHERRYLEHLRAEGREVVEIELPQRPGAFEEAHAATVAAMRRGADVIYQATFSRDGWRGRADFVVRVDEPSDLGPWSYEPYDTKLARSAKPDAVLQLSWYAQEIAHVQGRLPARVRVVLGTGEVEPYRPADVDAFLRRAQERLRTHVARVTDEPGVTYPWPCEHCSRCDFNAVCRERWRQDDHLTRVAAIRRDQIGKLAAVDVTTLTALAEAPADLRVRRLAAAMVEKLRDQAGLQLERYRHLAGAIPYRLLPPEPLRGLGLLPAPSPGDLFFDMEGDPFFDPAAGLEFLFGVLWREDGSTSYLPLRAHDRETEQRAFERFIDLVVERRAAHPDLHVYHYAAYEPSTLARLMGTHATREEEIDELLRGEVFVDLLQVVRQALRAGVESYGLKEIEQLFFTREAEVSSGNEAVIEFERWLDDRDPARLEAIEAYNREDCQATLELRDWLLARVPDAEAEHGVAIPFRPPPERPGPAPDAARDEAAELRDALLAAAVDGDGRALVAYLLDYHRREARPGWWWYFRRLQMTDDELTDDGEALGGLEWDGQEPEPVAQSLEWTFRFPAQQHHFDEGDGGEDPREGGTSWTVSAIDNATGVVRLRRGRKREGRLPTSLVPGGPYATDAQRAALRRVAAAILAGDDRYPHLLRLLRREPPLGGERVQCLELEEQRALLDRLDGSYLVVQGPPGSGKTYRAARLITHLLRQGRRVGLTAQSHKVIHNLLDAVEEAAAEEGLAFRGIKRGDHYRSDHIETSDDINDVLDLAVGLIAGTSWLHARDELEGTLDTLVVDEAGQYSLADALAAGTSARRLVLLGDPLQLAQVTQGVHPGGSGASVLEHVLGEERQTIPEEMGVFLEETRRMHPAVCRFISEAFYEERLRPIPETAGRTTEDGVGVRWLAVEHEGNRVESEEEAAAVAAEIERLVGLAYRDGATERPLTEADVMVVAPFNAQVRLLRDRLPAGVEVGTVDRFQGREAAVVFYSMASSSGEDVPRGLDFLLSRNRLNVAVSRAKCLAYVACSPRLLEVDCKTVEHLRLANALCRFVELAELRVPG